MLSFNERMRHITAKLERAGKHISDLQAQHDAFIKSNPYKISTRRDLLNQRLVYYVSAVCAPRDSIRTTFGDVLQNLISCLDHLAYQLVCIGKGSDNNFAHVYFPIENTSDLYESRKIKKTKGMRLNALQAIDAVKPYKEGNNILWKLCKLNNVDKHRLLVIVGTAFRSVDIGPHINQQIKKASPKIPFPNFSLFVKPANRKFPLKVGDRLFTAEPSAKANEKIKFVFEVALGENGIVEGEPLLETVNKFYKVVEEIVKSFRPLLA